MNRVEWEFLKSWREVQFASCFLGVASYDDYDLNIHKLTNVLDVRYNKHYQENEVRICLDGYFHPVGYLVINIVEEVT